MARNGLWKGHSLWGKALTQIFVWAPLFVSVWGVLYMWNRGVDVVSLSFLHIRDDHWAWCDGGFSSAFYARVV